VTRYYAEHREALLVAGWFGLLAFPVGFAFLAGLTVILGQTVSGGYKGLDSCVDPTVDQMQSYWNGTPYANWYIYIGGSTMTCRQDNLSTSWLQTVTGNVPGATMYWNLIPIWDGPQAPCNKVNAASFSTDPSTAYNQGVNEAVAAATKFNSLTGTWDFPIVYDLEPFTADLGSCSTSLPAAQSFISGWVHQLQIQPAQRAGVFGSGCDSHLQRFVQSNPVPDFIWGGDWGTAADPTHISCVADGYWTSHQRHKQWQAPHVEWSPDQKYDLQVDGDCSNGWMYGSSNYNWAACA
jgi:hypothetical protein